MAKVPFPPRRPADTMDGSDVSSPDTGDNFYPESNIPVDPEYMKRLAKGYKTPEKKTFPPVKKAKGGMVRGAGCAERGKGKGTMC